MNFSLLQAHTVATTGQHTPSQIGIGLLLGLTSICSIFLMGCDQKGKNNTLPHISLNDTMDAMAQKIGKATHDMAANSQMTVSFPKIADVRFQTPCEPLSRFLKNALQSRLNRIEAAQSIHWVDGTTLAPGAMSIRWEQLNNSTLQLTAHIWDERKKPSIKVATIQQPLKITDLSEDARKICLFKANPIDHHTKAGRPLLVRTAPASEASLIESGGQVTIGTPIWVEARIESSHWWLVRLEDNDKRIYGDRIRRGFVYGPIGPTRHAIIKTQKNEKHPSFAQVAKQHVQEKLTNSGIVFYHSGEAEKIDMRLHITISPSELRDSSDTLVAVEVRVTLSAEDLSVMPTTVMAQAEGRSKSVLGSPKDKKFGLEQATQEASRNAAQALLAAIEQRL